MLYCIFNQALEGKNFKIIFFISKIKMQYWNNHSTSNKNSLYAQCIVWWNLCTLFSELNDFGGYVNDSRKVLKLQDKISVNLIFLIILKGSQPYGDVSWDIYMLVTAILVLFCSLSCPCYIVVLIGALFIVLSLMVRTLEVYKVDSTFWTGYNPSIPPLRPPTKS